MNAFFRRSRGFTLVELIVVVAVIAILAAVAVPAYLRYSLRAGRVDAQQALLGIADAQERYYAAHNSYATTLAALGKKTTSTKGYYTLSLIMGAKNRSFAATATPVPGGTQVKDDCRALRIDDLGLKESLGNTSNGTCW